MMRSRFKNDRAARWVLASLAVVSAPLGSAQAGQAPEIRITESNRVPACVTPDRLMQFLKMRNHDLNPRFANIATFYKQHGEAWNVRWDYAFYQMAVETNFLTYRRPDGRFGDVNPKQNNFAGIGTTGGGVPGDAFPDVKTGVLGQIQHLVAYSGERMAKPVAPRTQLKQDDIILESQKLGRAVRFSDLARRWAVDPKYGGSIEWVADSYRSEFCRGRDQAAAQPVELKPRETLPSGQKQAASKVQAAPVPAPVVAAKREPSPAPDAARTVWVSSPRAEPRAVDAPRSQRVAVAPSNLGAGTVVAEAPAQPPVATAACSVTQASYGGSKSMLIKASANGQDRYTVLTVLDGFEKSMTGTFLKTHAPGGEMLGEFADAASALAKAREFCPGA